MVISFYLKKRSHDNDYGIIYCRIKIDKHRDPGFSTGIRVLENDWDTKRNRVKSSAADTAKLKLIAEHLKILYLDLVEKGKTVSPTILKKAYVEKSAKDEEKVTVIRYVNETIERFNDARITNSTKKTNRKNRNILLDFIKESKKVGMLIQELDYTFSQKYYKRLQKKYLPNTANKAFSLYKRIVTEAVEDNYIKHDVIRNLQIKRQHKNTHTYLTDTQLKKLEMCELTIKGLVKAKDLFLFQCYTGLAYSELRDFDFEKHTETFSRNLCIKMNRNKTINSTGIKSVIPLHEKALEILKKYDYKLPVFTNPYYNKRLKQVTKLAGLREPLMSHMGRRTFAMRMLNGGLPMQVISKMLGHADIMTTQRFYAKVPEIDISNNMNDILGAM